MADESSVDPSSTMITSSGTRCCFRRVSISWGRYSVPLKTGVTTERSGREASPAAPLRASFDAALRPSPMGLLSLRPLEQRSHHARKPLAAGGPGVAARLRPDARTEGTRPLRVLRQRADRVGQTSRVARCGPDCVVPLQHLAYRGKIADDDGAARRHVLEQLDRR